jgi:murein DD-endopeptidase MepM/ murein hydrolase activator NlpD
MTFCCAAILAVASQMLAAAPSAGAAAVSASVHALQPPLGLPTPTAAPPTPTATKGSNAAGATIYVVEEGDTLWSIAMQFGLTLEALVAANQLENPDMVQPGQELIIPGTDFELPSERSTAAAAATPHPHRAATATSPPTPLPAGEPTRRATAAPLLPEQATPVVRPLPVTANPGSFLHAICPGTVAAHDIGLPADPIYLLLAGDWLYIIAGGDLYRLPLAATAAGNPPPAENLIPAERKVGAYVIRELVYAALDQASGDLLLLDKSNDIFHFTAAGEWSLPFPATQVPDQFPDPQFLAVQPPAGAHDGAAFALDADLSTIWQFLPGSGLPHIHREYSGLLDALDFYATTGDGGETVFVVLMRDGSVRRWDAEGLKTLYPPQQPGRGAQPWLSHLVALDEGLGIVDAQRRALTVIHPETGDVLREVEFRLPLMQRLRSAALADDKVYAVSGDMLYVGDLAAKDFCPPAAFDDSLYFHGYDLQALLPELGPPFPGVFMPERPRSYPGARRLYRNGIHEGVDLYGTDAPGVSMGSNVNAIAAGRVARADTSYVEMLPAEYEAAIARTFAEHRTPPDLVDAFLGRQVHVVHSAGVESRYGHLGAVARGITPTVTVEMGETVGKVGVSGTSAGAYGTDDGVHLHFEIWIDGRYVGQGLSLYETMRIWQALFAAND